MTAFTDWSMGRRLAAAFGVLSLLVAAFLAATLGWLEENGRILEDYSVRLERQVAISHAMEDSVLEASIAFRTYLLRGESDERAAYDQAIARAQALYVQFGPGVRDAAVREQHAAVGPMLAKYADETAKAMQLRDSGGLAAIGDLRSAVRAELAKLTRAQEASGRRGLETVKENRRAIVRGIWMAGLVLVAALLVIGYLTTRSIREPARALAAVAADLERGEWPAALGLRPAPPGTRNEMRLLESALGAAARELEHRERRLRETGERIREQNEELQAQNEEIQAQNEEIQAQSEEIQAQSEEIEAQSEELRAQNEELRVKSGDLGRQARRLQEQDARKNEFLGILAHELRNPLAPLVNCLQLLQRLEPGSAGFARTRDIMERQMRHLTRLVDDLLDVTRVSHGKIDLRRERLDIVQLSREVLDDFRDAAERGGVTLAGSFPPEPLWTHADGTRLRQVLGNLVGNAIKFTPPQGRVEMVLHKIGDATAEVRIVDTGVGVDDELLKRLFQPFSQAPSEPGGRPNAGLGLGLALAKALVTLHGGSVHVHSDGRGRGTEFVVRLPLATAAEAGRSVAEHVLRLAAESLHSQPEAEDAERAASR